MNCTECKNRLPLLLSPARDEIEDPEVCAHLAACPACLQEWQEFEQLGKLLSANPEPRVAVDLSSLYRQAAAAEAQSSRRWRWLGLAAGLFLLVGGSVALFARLELRVTGNELALRWGEPPAAPANTKLAQVSSATEPFKRDDREEQIEVLSAMVRAMLQELQTVELRQRRDRNDIDLRVSGLQEQTLKRWLALQKDLEALYVLTQKGD
jgi:hypothetical protein